MTSVERKNITLFVESVHHTQVSCIMCFRNVHYPIDGTRKSPDALLMQLTVVIGQYINNIKGKDVM